MISGKVVGPVGGKSCSKRGGPPGVKVELMTESDELVASALTSSSGEYSFTNIIPGFSLRALFLQNNVIVPENFGANTVPVYLYVQFFVRRF